MNKNFDNFRKTLSSGALLVASPVLAQYSPTPQFTGHLGKTVEETKTAHVQYNTQAKEGAPNVVWILLDDVGFGAASAFGGLIETPTFDYLAQNGLRFNNFHTTSISAPTRAALLTGRNHHSSHVGYFNDDYFATPGYDTYGPMENGTIAEVLRENGYNTFAIGKYNFTPMQDGSNSGPFNRWPTGRGFDHYFGYNPTTAADDQWHPYLYKDTQRVPDDSLGELAITRFTDQAIQYIADQKSADPDKPFFLYFAPGTAHVPLQTTPEWINKYKGKFDEGWDVAAERILQNQIRLGVVPPNTKLPVRNRNLDRWKDLSDVAKKVYAHQMEVYAGFLSQADYEIGRIVEFLRYTGQLDNTIIFISIGDNGAEAAGRQTGITAEYGLRGAQKDSLLAAVAKDLDRYGDETTYPAYPEGWAEATSTPFRYYKGYPEYEGGTHNGLIVHYPKGIKDKGGIRSQYTHVIDVLPTTVEITGSVIPEKINGYVQNPVEGFSFANAIVSEDNNVESLHKVQYYELVGAHALYKDGWKAQFPNDTAFVYRLRGKADLTPHLYHIAEDFNESTDLAKKYPEKLKELEAVFEKEARKYNVFPLRSASSFDKNARQKKQRSHYDIFIGPKNWSEYSDLLDLGKHSDSRHNRHIQKSHSLTATIDIKTEHPNGVLFSYTGRFTNFSFYLKDGVPVYSFKKHFSDKEYIKVIANKKVNTGVNNVRADIDVDPNNNDGIVSIFINDEKVASKNIGNIGTISLDAHSGTALQLGRSWGNPASDDYKSPNYLNEKYLKATIDIKAD